MIRNDKKYGTFYRVLAKGRVMVKGYGLGLLLVF